jgi:hypothetical protein
VAEVFDERNKLTVVEIDEIDFQTKKVRGHLQASGDKDLGVSKIFRLLR